MDARNQNDGSAEPGLEQRSSRRHPQGAGQEHDGARYRFGWRGSGRGCLTAVGARPARQPLGSADPGYHDKHRSVGGSRRAVCSCTLDHALGPRKHVRSPGMVSTGNGGRDIMKRTVPGNRPTISGGVGRRNRIDS